MAGDVIVAICPICKSEAAVLDKTGAPDGFDCPHHGRFKVSSTVFAVSSFKDASREQWEAALKKAKAKATPDEWAPCITTYDF
jgi:hypothetical protein